MKKKLIFIFTIDIVLIVIALIIYNPFLKLNLNGKNEVEIAFGSEYQETGVLASYFGKDLGSNVLIENNVDFSKIGTYKIKYVLKHGLSVRVRKANHNFKWRFRISFMWQRIY